MRGLQHLRLDATEENFVIQGVLQLASFPLVESGIPKTNAHHILTDVQCKISAQWEPRFLSTEQKAERMCILQELLMCYANEGELFLQQIITMDETWICDFELELKSQSNVRATCGD